jgi:hypothetical protein
MTIRPIHAAPAILALSLLVFACSPAGLGGGSGPGARAPSATDLIAAIPSIDSLLPKSLQAGKSGSGKALSRALGDVSTLNPALLQGVTSSGYKQLNQSINQSMVKQVLALLKAGLQGKDVAFDTPYRIGVTTMPADIGMTAPDGSNQMDLGIITITKVTAEVTEARWYIKISQSMDGTTTNLITIPYYLFIRITGTDPATMKVKVAFSATYTYQGQTMEMNNVCDYDAATKSMKSVRLPQGAGDSGGVQAVSTANGFVTYYDISDQYKSVAYANDAEGGVVNYNKWTDPQSSITSENIWTEFYNGSGDLVMSQYGDSGSNNSCMGWQINQINTGKNIKDLTGASQKPAVLYKKTTFSWDGFQNTRTISWSADNATWVPEGSPFVFTNWADCSWSWDNPVWRASTTAAADDSIYYYNSGDWTNTYDQASKTWINTSTYTYKIGYTIPSPQSYLGGSYYMQNNFLLKHCSLPAEMQGKFELKMREGSTYYCYSTDKGNNWTSGDTAQDKANWESVSDNYRSSWTNYEYWLENLAYVDSTGANAVNDPNAKNPDKGDMDAPNLQEQNFWYWENGHSKQVKAQVISSTETQPVGFDFNDQSLVASVKSQIESVFATQVPSLQSLSLKDLADAIIVMPATSTFPTY